MTHRPWSGWALALAAGSVPVLGMLMPKSMVVVLLVLGVAVVARRVADRDWVFDRRSVLARLSLLMVAGLVWAGLSLLWVDDLAQGTERLVKLAVLGLFGILATAEVATLSPDRRSRVGAALAGGLALAMALMLLDIALSGALRRLLVDDPAYYGIASLNRSATIVALLIWPAACWLWPRARLAAIGLVAVCALVMTQVESASAYTAFILGLAIFGLARWRLRAVALTLAASCVAAIVLAPLAAVTVLHPDLFRDFGDRLPSPALHRLYIWNFTAERIFEKPVLGWGLDASRNIPGATALVTSIDDGLSESVFGAMILLPLHPHNAPLQLWLELGLPGALVLAALVGGLLYATARRFSAPLAGAGATTAIVVGLALSSFSYGIWQGWWYSLLWLAAAIAVAVLDPVPHQPPPACTARGHEPVCGP